MKFTAELGTGSSYGQHEEPAFLGVLCGTAREKRAPRAENAEVDLFFPSLRDHPKAVLHTALQTAAAQGEISRLVVGRQQ